MGSFIYFVPGDGPLTEDEQNDLLDRHGLGYALERPLFAPIRRGPSADDEPGPPGLLVGEDAAGIPPRLDEDRQQWRLLDAERGTWLGWYPERLPGPRELARRQQLSGWLVELGDPPQPWHVPCARRWHDQGEDAPACHCALPQGFTLVDGHWIRGGVKARYRPLWQLVEAYFAALTEAAARVEDDRRTSITFQFDQLDDLAVGALQLNYRVGPVELDVLGCYDEEGRQRIVEAVMDERTAENLIKKKLAAAEAAAGSG